MSLTKRVARIGFLMVAATGLLYWINHHAEVTFADGLRYIREAQQIDRGDLAGGLLRAVDHPIHPLAIVAALSLRPLTAGIGPYEGQGPYDLADRRRRPPRPLALMLRRHLRPFALP